MAIRFGVSSTVKNRLPRYSNFWDGTAVFSPFTPSSSYDALATYTVPSGGVASVTFAGLPTGGQYEHLQIRAISRSTNSSTYSQIHFKTNNATSYFRHLILADGINNPPGAYGYTGQSNLTFFYSTGNNAIANVFGAGILDILDYADTNKFKTCRGLGGANNNSVGDAYISMTSGAYPSTDPINSITFQPETGNFAQYTQFSIYGVR